MRQSRLLVATLLALVGAVWIGQGTGLIAGSAMSGTMLWAVVGLILIGAAAAIVLRERRQSAKS